MQHVHGVLVRASGTGQETVLGPVSGRFIRIDRGAEPRLWCLLLAEPLPLPVGPDDALRLDETTFRILATRYDAAGRLTELTVTANASHAAPS